MNLQTVIDKGLGLVVPLFMLIAWEAATRLGIVPITLLVPPRQVLETFQSLVSAGELQDGLKVSLARVGAGFLLGASAGFLLGSAMGLSRTIERYVGPLFHSIRQVPLLGLMPLLMLCLGIGELFKVVFIAIGALYPMTLKTYEGIRGVPRSYVEVVRVFEYSRFKLLCKVLLPAALPSIIYGLRLSLGMAWMLVVGAELVAASEGVGYMMTMGRQLFQMDVVLVGVIVIGTVGFMLNQLFVMIETRYLGWRKAFTPK